MTRKELLEFIELPEPASDDEISSRLAEKLVYFKRLMESAPNEFLRQLHSQNIEKIKLIQEESGYKAADPDIREAPPVRKNTPTSRPADAAPVAWLIRHTEDRPTLKFPLFPGENCIGRSVIPGKKMVLIDDDPYISRIHAAIYADDRADGYNFFIQDSPASNGGKASKNGTYINGDDERIAGRMQLHENDTVQVGMTKLILKVNNHPVSNIISEVEESGYMKTVVINIF